MQNVLIVGAGTGGTTILNLLLNLKFMNVLAIVDKDEHAPGLQIAKKRDIKYGSDWKEFLTEDCQIVFDVTGDQEVFDDLLKTIPPDVLLIPGSVANLLVGLLIENDSYIRRLQTERDRQKLIFNSIEEGMIGINSEGVIDFINESAVKMLEVSDKNVIGRPIFEFIPDSKLKRVVNTGTPELNEELTLPNGLKIVSSRYPLHSADGEVFGAFAVFKDVSEVMKLAEEITDLKQVKTMLEAIIHSSDDAISVVDEKGNGVLVNPAYTRMTGLTEDEIIGKPATVDINEGESIHMRVLQTKKPVRGVNMRIGEDNRDVIVNVAPILVNSELKGSVGVIHDTTEIKRLLKELNFARAVIRKLENTYTFADIYGDSPDIRLSVEQAKVAASSDLPVMLRGENGTGKELFANAIHSSSSRKNSKFIRVNCTAIEPSSMKEELFGKQGEAHTSKRTGLIEEAESGTLFLNEITALPLMVQKALYTYLTEDGGNEKVRLIVASSKNLERAIHDGTFDEKLFYFLNRLSILIPPLRMRMADLPEIIHHLLQKLNREFGMNVEKLNEAAYQMLRDYDWPGNVRELENVLSRAMIYVKKDAAEMDGEDIRRSLQTGTEKPSKEQLPQKSTLGSIMDEFEKSVIEKALNENSGNKSMTASRLGISLRSLYYKMEKFKLI